MSAEMRACGGFIALVSLVFLSLSIFTPGVAWFGIEKVVLFENEQDNASLEVASSFRFAYLWTRQKISTEVDAVVYQEDGYGWCAGTTPAMPAPTQRALCNTRRLMWLATALYYLLGMALVAGSCFFTGQRRRNLRRLAHGLSALSALQLVSGIALSYLWATIKRIVEAYFTANYVEVNGLRMRAGWGWYLAGFAGLASTALLLLNLYLSWQAQRHPLSRDAAGAGAKGLDGLEADDASVTNHSVNSDIMRQQTNSSSVSSASSSSASPDQSPARPGRHYQLRSGQQARQQQQHHPYEQPQQQRAYLYF